MKTTNERLKDLMYTHRLRRIDVARLTNRRSDTVASWCRTKGKTGYRNMPKHALELLELKLTAGEAS